MPVAGSVPSIARGRSSLAFAAPLSTLARCRVDPQGFAVCEPPDPIRENGWGESLMTFASPSERRIRSEVLCLAVARSVCTCLSWDSLDGVPFSDVPPSRPLRVAFPPPSVDRMPIRKTRSALVVLHHPDGFLRE